MGYEELLEENEHLQKIYKIVDNQLAHCIKRLEEIPHEHKGMYDGVKWGDDDLVEDLMKKQYAELRKLKFLQDKPYFGSFNFNEKDKPNKKYYIGKGDLMDPFGFQYILDWRNPICTLYYDQSLGEVTYKAPAGYITGDLTKKSQIIIEDKKVKRVKEVDLVTQDELLKPYLNVNADSRMKTIIASIQKEQNIIIRMPINKNSIIQGVAGSGKTSVALHRIAYLIYNYISTYKPEQYLIIGPNKFFLNYISTVLPDLDTSTIQEFTFEELASIIIDDPKYSYQKSNDELQTYLKSNNNFDRIKKIKGTIEYKEAILKFLNDYFEATLSGGITYLGKEILPASEIIDNIELSSKYVNSINKFVNKYTKKFKENYFAIYTLFSKDEMPEILKLPKDSEERKERFKALDDIKSYAKKGFNKELKQKIKPLLLDPVALYRLFLENIEHYINLNEEEKKYIKEVSLKSLKNKTVLYEDIPGILYLKLMRDGCMQFENVKHIAIDEAQDYNLLIFDLLKSIFYKGSFSIYGDIAQSIYDYRSIDNWEDLVNLIFKGNADIEYLSNSYRTTMEITENANQILEHLNLRKATPVVRKGEEVSFISEEQISNNDIMYYQSIYNNYINKNYKSLGIICKDSSEIEYVSNILSSLNINFNVIKNADNEYNGGINILTGYLAKGLEFDAVVINDASEEKYNSSSSVDMHLLYVSCTRALHELHIKYKKELSKAFDSKLTIEKTNENNIARTRKNC